MVLSWSKTNAKGEKKMKKFLIFIAIIAGISIFGKACGDETTTYYQDKNGNGKADLGEGAWYEDDDGIHFFD